MCSLTVGCLSECLNCPAVTTEISISVTPHALNVCGEYVRMKIDFREISICPDIDQVECSQGEHLV